MNRKKLLRAGSMVACACVLGVWVGLAQSAEPPSTAPATQPATQPAKPRPEKPGNDEGWVSGTVLGLDGKLMAQLPIRAERNDPIGMGGGGPKLKRPREVRGTTDDNGNFLFVDLQPEREYTIIAGSEEIGWVYEAITIVPGKEIKLGEIKMIKLN
jgi:hypothetical protein